MDKKKPSKLVAVKIERAAYDLLDKHAAKVSRTKQYLLTRAIERCYTPAPDTDSRKEPRA